MGSAWLSLQAHFDLTQAEKNHRAEIKRTLCVPAKTAAA